MVGKSTLVEQARRDPDSWSPWGVERIIVELADVRVRIALSASPAAVQRTEATSVVTGDHPLGLLGARAQLGRGLRFSSAAIFNRAARLCPTATPSSGRSTVA